MRTTTRDRLIGLAAVSLSLLASPAPHASAAPQARSRAARAAAKADPAANVQALAVADGIVACQFGHFWVVTDLPEEEARRLVVRLETMVQLISAYWVPDARRRAAVLQKLVIPCLVFKNTGAWPRDVLSKLDADGVLSARSGGGVTVAQALYLGRVAVDATAVVYASAEHGTPQHEAVHAFCQLTFATTGPTWYSEGMAEMGQYWREGDSSVSADPRIIDYLRSEQPKKTLQEVLAPFQPSGDNWQNYAWRWALCHLLATNPNYAADFRRLGLMYLDKGRVHVEEPLREQFWLNDFRGVFGARWREIEFEYRFFLEHVESGFRADLCAWDWRKKFAPCTTATRPVTVKVLARGGWQPSGLSLAEGQQFEYAASGTWKTSAEGPATSADGESEGRGRLEAVLLDGGKLGEPFELRAEGVLNAPAKGNLYLRCRDQWNALDDNSGTITVRFKHRGKSG